MKKYSIIAISFILLIGLLTYINTNSSTTFSLLGINITLYNAIWSMIFLFTLYLISILYFSILKYKSFTFERNIKKDKINLLKNIENKIFYKNKQFPIKVLKELDEFTKMIEGLKINPVSSETFPFMEDLKKIENSEVVDLSKYKLDKNNPWVIKNLEIKVNNNDLEAAKEAIKIDSLKEKASKLIWENSSVSEILANAYPISKEIILNNLDNSRLKELINKSTLTNEEYIEIAKVLYKKESNNPENVMNLFEEKTVPYVYLLIKYEMLDKARELAKENELKFFEYYLDLKEKNVKLDEFLDARHF